MRQERTAAVSRKNTRCDERERALGDRLYDVRLDQFVDASFWDSSVSQMRVLIW